MNSQFVDLFDEIINYKEELEQNFNNQIFNFNFEHNLRKPLGFPILNEDNLFLQSTWASSPELDELIIDFIDQLLFKICSLVKKNYNTFENYTDRFIMFNMKFFVIKNENFFFVLATCETKMSTKLFGVYMLKKNMIDELTEYNVKTNFINNFNVKECGDLIDNTIFLLNGKTARQLYFCSQFPKITSINCIDNILTIYYIDFNMDANGDSEIECEINISNL